MKKLNQWQKLLLLIESTEIGSVISRKQVLKCGEKNPDAHLVYSVDAYRRYLTLLKVLEKTPKPGCYKVTGHIPFTLSKNSAVKLAYRREK